MEVLIPLLLDDPLWVTLSQITEMITKGVLIPLLLDDPLWAICGYSKINQQVLIPLLLDDPLWGPCFYHCYFIFCCLNPSFAG